MGAQAVGYYRSGIAAACIVVIFWLAGVAFAQSIQFSRIDVEGNQRVEDETIRVFSGLTPGEAVDQAELNAAFQRLFDTGLFENVTITPGNGRVLISVTENPTINIVNFEGNRRIDDEILASVVSLEERDPFSRSAVEADVRAIQEVYARQGRINAAVVPRIIRLDDNRVNLVYEIDEAGVTEVQRISFVGNEAFTDRRLRRVIETGQAGLFSFFFSNDIYDQDRLNLDQERLREFYLNRGYIDFQVLSATAEFARERDAFFVAFTLSEGAQYSFGDSFVTAFAPGIDPAEFEALIDLRPGQVYSAERVDRVIDEMAFLAGQKGFAFVEVSPRISRDEVNRRVDIEFELIEGPRVFIERIDIRGNRETVDRVIRREFRVVEGDAFNSREIRRAEDRLRALGFFERVEVRVREGSSPGRAVITVDVEEAPTGSLTFGAAFGSTEGLTGTISLSERNFLGRGQAVSLELAVGEESNVIAFNFNEPRVFDQDLSAGFQLSFREFRFDESSIDTRRTAFVPNVGFPLSEDSRLTLRLRLSQDEISVRGDDVSPILEREAGDEFALGLGAAYTLDRRNSRIDPTAGFIFQLDQEFAGLGGGPQFSKTEARARAFTSFFDENVILSAEVEGGAVLAFNQESRFIDRFVLGGDSFRGFRRGGIGPRDNCDACGGPSGTEDVNDALGGNMFTVARLEATFPIGLPPDLGIFGGVFADAGSLWSLYDTDGAQGTVDDSFILRSSVGASLFWDTAIGPLRFNFARPIQSEPGDESEFFRITVDTRF